MDDRVEQITRGRADLAVAAFDRDWPSWRGRSIEPVVRESMTRLARTGDRLVDVETVRPWWTRDGSVEVDVVAMTPARTAVVGSVKWRPEGGLNDREMRALTAARDRVPRSEDALLAAITPSGDPATGADIVIGADDLLSAWRTS